MSAVSAALNGFSIFLITYHTSDNQRDDPRKNRAYQKSSHMKSSPDKQMDIPWYCFRSQGMY